MASNHTTRRNVLTTAVAGLTTVPVALIASIAQASDRHDPSAIDTVLTEAWEARAEKRYEISTHAEDAPDELVDEMVRIEDAILDALASDPPRTPTVIAVEAAMELCDDRHLADRVVTTPFAAMLMSRVEDIADQLTGRLRDDMAEIIADPDKPYGLCRLYHCGGVAYAPPPPRRVGRDNMLYRFECMLALGVRMLEDAYPKARVDFRCWSYAYDKVADAPGEFSPEGVLFDPQLYIEGDDQQFHRDLAEWRELQAHIRAIQPDAAEPTHS